MTKSKKVVFSTTVFPMEELYLHDFFRSLQKQTYKDFDVLVLNDKFEYLDEFIKQYPDLNIIILPYNGTSAQNRKYSIDYIKEKNYDIAVFGDSDDYFSPNRIEKSIEFLNDYDIVVNDLSLFNTDGVYNDKYISNRIANRTNITIDMIKDKSSFGASNTAVQVDIISEINFDRELIAVDWYLFSKLLLDGNKAVFTNETLTYYRQYSLNTVGIGDITKDIIKRGIEVKFMHYHLLSKQDQSFLQFFNEIKKLKERLVNDDDVDKFIKILKKVQRKFPLWWEDIKLYKE